jgi:m7GpppX diphosphatase
VSETPEVYAKVVQPFIASFPAERTAWVDAILNGEKEAERVLHRSSGDQGFVLLPDLKWDGTTLAALYLTAIAHDGRIKSMRDLTRAHLPLLRKIRAQAYETAGEKYGVESGDLRLFIHYQPSYCEWSKVRRVGGAPLPRWFRKPCPDHTIPQTTSTSM